MPSFVFAVLLHEGLVKHSLREKRRYERTGDEVFEVFTKTLVEGKSAVAISDARDRKTKGKPVAFARLKNDKKSAKSA